MANLPRNLSLSLLFLLAISKTNGSSCRYCDENNVMGFAYKLHCVNQFQPNTRERKECVFTCVSGCWEICRGGRGVREHQKWGSVGKLRVTPEDYVLECPSAFTTAPVIITAILVPIGVVLFCIGAAACVFGYLKGRKRSQGMGGGLNNPMRPMQGQPGMGAYYSTMQQPGQYPQPIQTYSQQQFTQGQYQPQQSYQPQYQQVG